MNFYIGAPRFLPPVLTALGYACLAFNRRGHDILGIRNSRAAEGAAFQTYARGDRRITSSPRSGSRSAAFPHPVVIGHSNGGMLARAPCRRPPADAGAGPAVGALRRQEHAAAYPAKPASWRRTAWRNSLREARRKGPQGSRQGTDAAAGVVVRRSPPKASSTCRNCPDILELAPRIACPTLYVRGDKEPRDLYPAEEFARRAKGACEVRDRSRLRPLLHRPGGGDCRACYTLAGSCVKTPVGGGPRCASTGTSRSRWTTGWCCAPTSFVRTPTAAIRSSSPTARTPRARVPGRLSERVAAHGGRASRRRLRLEQPLPELGSRRSREVGARGLRLRARRLARRRPLARLHRSVLAARDEGLLPVHRVGRRAAVVERQGRPERHLVLRHQPVARRLAAAAAPRRDLHLGRRGRLVPRHDAPRRHRQHLLGQLVRHAGEERAVRPGRARAEEPRQRQAGVRRRDAVATPSWRRTAATSATRSSPIRSTTTTTRARSPVWDKITVPLLTAANWGGQGLHPRGNFEGFVRAHRRTSGSKRTASSTGRTSTPTTAASCSCASSIIS